MYDQTAIVGLGSTPYYRRGASAPQTLEELVGKSILAATADAGLTIRDIDGFAYFAGGFDSGALTETLGIPEIRFSATLTGTGGGSAGAIGLAAAIDYVTDIGVGVIDAHERALARAAREALRSVNSLTLFGPDESAGIVSFALAGVHPHDIGTILDESGVAIRAGHHCCQPLMKLLGVPATARASFAVYNDLSDVDRLVDGVQRVTRIFG